MTYAFVTEWMQPDDQKKFDRELSQTPAEQAQTAARELMAVFGMAQGMGA